jgi:ABC-type nitrate/sulfonate/bicarbonate transport system substrate-binding protein
MKVRLAAGSGPTFGVDDLACAAATHLGCWSELGLDVTWTPVRGGIAAIQAVVDGAVDVSYGGLGPVLKYRSEGHAVRVIVSMARALAQNLVAQRRITKPADLRGVSWAIDGVGALSHHMARLIVRNLGIAETEITWKVLGPPPERIAGLLSGEVDVSLLRVEEAIALDRDDGNSLHNMMGFSELKALVPIQPHGVLATSERLERENPDLLGRIALGMIKASRLLNDDYAAFRNVYDHYVSVKLPDAVIEGIWQQERASGGFALNGELTSAHWQRQIELFYALNPALPVVQAQQLIARQFVDAALAKLGERPT